MRWTVDGVQRVIAHTLASNATSQGVLTRAGFHAAGPGTEPGVLRFERSRADLTVARQSAAARTPVRRR